MDSRRLTRLVQDYRHRFGDWRAMDRKRWRNMPDLATAIRIAALARTAGGKCESHQRRIGLKRLMPFERATQKRRRAVAASRSFDALMKLIEEARTAGVGELAVYDTAVRVGQYLGLAPERVYLHAGTRAGAMALGLDTSRGVLERDELPAPLRRLSCDEVEDFLCIYKDALRGSVHAWRSRPGCMPARGGVC